MSEPVIIENPIGWCDATTNAVTGCDKVSPGCKNCYAAVGMRARVLRYGGDPKYPDGIETWGPNGVRVAVAGFAMKLRRFNTQCICETCRRAYPIAKTESATGQPHPLGFFGWCKHPGCFVDQDTRSRLRRIRLFADSNSDWLDPKWPVDTLARFLEAIMLAPNVDVQLLTKRIELFNQRILAVTDWIEAEGAKIEAAKPGTWAISDLFDWIENQWLDGEPPKHLWLGVSIESQQYDRRMAELVTTPAHVRFYSMEPLLGPVNLHLPWREVPGAYKPDWVIVGGESGDDRRDCGVEAITDIAEQCVAGGVPVYVKQDCAFKSGQQGRIPDNIWQLKQFPKVV